MVVTGRQFDNLLNLMKLIYLTSKTFPATTADHFFVLEMAKAFALKLKNDFLLVVWNGRGKTLEEIPHYSLGMNTKKGKSLFYFVWLPFFILSKKLYSRDTVFFSNDQPLLSHLFFWKKILGFKYRVISDWHMISGGPKELKSAKKSDGMITTTKHLKDLLVSRFGPSEKKILTAYGGVDLSLFKVDESREDLRRRLELPEKSFLVGYIGLYKTMGLPKGIDTMIDATALLQGKNITMVFVGGKPDEITEYKAYTGKKKILGYTIFIPVVSSKAVAEYEQAMDALVIPYPDLPHFRNFGFPMKAYEYLASKKPVIYSNLPIMGEVLADCAVSFTPGDSRDLAQKITDIQNSPEKASALVSLGYEKAKDCTWEKRAEKILEFAKAIK